MGIIIAKKSLLVLLDRVTSYLLYLKDERVIDMLCLYHSIDIIPCPRQKHI